MKTLHTVLTFLHISGGIPALVSGLLLVFLPKGDARHRKLGLVFAGSMYLTGICSLFLSLLQGNVFLLGIGGLSLYLTFSGQMALKRYRNANLRHSGWFDGLALVLLASLGLVLAWVGVTQLQRENFFGLVILGFALFSGRLCWSDGRRLKSPREKGNQFLLIHFQRMMGSFISAFTAFLVVRDYLGLGWVSWLVPTLVFTPLIVYWSRQHKTPPRNQPAI